MIVGPTPKRLETAFAVNAASSEPRLPTEKTSPITPGESSSSRTAKTRKIEKAMLQKRFDVAVHPAERAGTDCRARTAGPPSAPSSMLRFSAASGLAARRLFPLADASRKVAEARKLKASTSTATGR